jgi:hypothetical protein
MARRKSSASGSEMRRCKTFATGHTMHWQDRLMRRPTINEPGTRMN